MNELYMNQKNRNEKVKELKAKGLRVRKTSITNQLLHPMYVSDFAQETGTVLTQADKGFGNDIYKTYFKALYSYEIDHSSMRLEYAA